MAPERHDGLVLKGYGGFYYVQDHQNQIYECKLRGKIKQQILTGDRVIFSDLEESRGILESVLPRRNQLNRPRIANADLALIVMANSNPAPSLTLLDRLLFLVQHYGLEPCIIINKADLPTSPAADDIISYYHGAGFTVITSSVILGKGLDEVKRVINKRIAVLTGPSGAGKSSLLNSLAGTGASTGEVSNKIGRGRHTTRHVELYPLPGGGWIADTPGFSVLDLPPVESRNVDAYYPDFKMFLPHCRFLDCLHYKEKDCGVKQAVSEGIIAEFRYQNYVAMLEEVLKNERCYR